MQRALSSLRKPVVETTKRALSTGPQQRYLPSSSMAERSPMTRSSGMGENVNSTPLPSMATSPRRTEIPALPAPEKVPALPKPETDLSKVVEQYGEQPFAYGWSTDLDTPTRSSGRKQVTTAGHIGMHDPVSGETGSRRPNVKKPLEKGHGRARPEFDKQQVKSFEPRYTTIEEDVGDYGMPHWSVAIPGMNSEEAVKSIQHEKETQNDEPFQLMGNRGEDGVQRRSNMCADAVARMTSTPIEREPEMHDPTTQEQRDAIATRGLKKEEDR